MPKLAGRIWGGNLGFNSKFVLANVAPNNACFLVLKFTFFALWIFNRPKLPIGSEIIVVNRVKHVMDTTFSQCSQWESGAPDQFPLKSSAKISITKDRVATNHAGEHIQHICAVFVAADALHWQYDHHDWQTFGMMICHHEVP
jgi:hypothetical protein